MSIDSIKIIRVIVDSMPIANSSLVDILSALLVPAIALIGAYIAYQQFRINSQQYRINQLRLRHELYERRLEIYKTVQNYLSEIQREGKTTGEKVYQFYSKASEAVFLFDESVQVKIDSIYEKSNEMVTTHNKMYPSDGSPGLPVGEERNKVAKIDSELLQWHVEELNKLRKFFIEKIGLRVT